MSSDIENKYFKKYKDILNQPDIVQLLGKYKAGPISYTPIREVVAEQDQDDLYRMIDNSGLLVRKDRLKAIIGFMMVLDGVFPDEEILSLLKITLGKDFVNSVQQKREE